MKVKHASLLSVLLLAAMSWSCAPDALQDLTPEDSQVFITNYQKSANFRNYQTFSLADSVYLLQNQRTGVSTLPLDFRILGRVADNLTKRGYKRILRSEKPDLGVNVIRISETQSGVVANYNPWNSYWGYGGGGGFYYPPTYSYYESTETYWYIEIVDLKNAVSGQQPSIIWNAQIRGSGIFDESTLASVVENVFTQSTYLKKN
ncbi:DUF4136 domain-containing protein [Runella sp.]|jgi:hypothetical protein|uniref:DUF4136 domain-containing protein n=1 Tax=Runella sp. TaxID=1960881 RepID=UPI002602341C|nr:DUF4136 domain-containing protein [Runella sp.]